MRLFISKAAVLGLCACALLAACSPQDGSAPAVGGGGSSASTADGNPTAQPAKPAQRADETRRISIEETQAAVAAGTAIIVDVREEMAYKGSHIKGAKSIPLSRFEERAGELPKDKLIITYCA
jgi:3-mercaptopyruvate sulfurtransferase SseA